MSDLADFSAFGAFLLSGGALITAIWARSDSKLSADSSVTSARASEKSADTAEASLELSRMEAARRAEAADVEWEFETTGDGNFFYRNTGQSSAYSVTALVRINGHRFDFAEDLVESDELLHLNATELWGQLAEVADKDRRSKPDYVISPGYLVTLTARVSWFSPLGQASIEVYEQRFYR